MSAALTRRAALRGSAAALAGLGTVAAAVASADAALMAQASAFRALQAREHAAWGDLDELDEGPEVDACRALSTDLREAGEALAGMPAVTPAGLGAKAAAVLTLVGPRLDTEYSLGEHQALVASILRDAVRLGGGAHA